MSAPARPQMQIGLRSLLLSVYLPSLIFAIGQGAVIPIVALDARELGASVAVAGLAVALRGLGQVCFSIPAGQLVARLGERRAMLLATAALSASLAGCVTSPSPVYFAACLFVMGCGWSVWLIARLTYVTDMMPLNLRGRALSTLGGIQRIGQFIGPFIGAVIVTVTGLNGVYYLHIALAIIGCLVLYVVPDPDTTTRPISKTPIRPGVIGREHGSTFLTAGLGAMTISTMRASRQVVLPLWAAGIGLDAAQVSVIFGVSAAMDMTLFYPAGVISDRWGRKAVAVPTLLVLALGMLLVPFTSSFTQLVGVGILMGFGNGLGSGIVMTLGSDFAPRVGRAEFLGVWRLVTEAGTAGGPLVVAGIEAVASLAAASIAIGLFGVLGATLVVRRVPEPIHRHRLM